MADGTNIEWADATWNPITGCQVKSAVLVGNDVYDRDAYILRVGKKLAGRLLDGRTHDGFRQVSA